MFNSEILVDVNVVYTTRPWLLPLGGDRKTIIRVFLVISILIDSDRGHCCEHLKKKYDEN